MDAGPSRPRERIKALLAQGLESLRQAHIESPELDAELLLAQAAGVARSRLLTGSFSLNDHIVDRFGSYIARRAAREPVAYIIGHREFYGLDFEVSPAVLIPRPETEVLVEAALSLVSGGAKALVLDLGTGSGAIAVAMAVNAGARVIATDISAAALMLARRNAGRHGCRNRVDSVCGDGFAPLSCSHVKFDLILSNPPYVRDHDIARLEPEVAQYEPRAALRGGTDGLDFYRRIAAEAAPYLKPGGGVMLEVGAGQAEEVARIFAAARWRVVQTLPDLGGHQRVVHLRREF